ncbi:hypothetical protein LTS10_002028 [Elasticomyces elasticus]|nr:hypothetical protein LTS10_002028 [Elasticomyces elasticus]
MIALMNEEEHGSGVKRVTVTVEIVLTTGPGMVTSLTKTHAVASTGASVLAKTLGATVIHMTKIADAVTARNHATALTINESFRGETGLEGAEVQPEKQKPNFKPTGLLAKEANTVAGTTTILKYHEPPEGRKPSPKEQWRMYVFKEKDLVDTIYLHTRSVWLCGRDKKVTDLLLEHPSTSKQHAVIQFRYITSTNEFGDKSSKVKPYLIDLDSANGTKLNGKKVDGSKYVELLDGDVVGFGDSEREYVMMLPPPA